MPAGPGGRLGRGAGTDGMSETGVAQARVIELTELVHVPDHDLLVQAAADAGVTYFGMPVVELLGDDHKDADWRRPNGHARALVYDVDKRLLLAGVERSASEFVAAYFTYHYRFLVLGEGYTHDEGWTLLSINSDSEQARLPVEVRYPALHPWNESAWVDLLDVIKPAWCAADFLMRHMRRVAISRRRSA